MLAQRNTPRDDGQDSIAQRLMTRNKRTPMDTHAARMIPKVVEDVPLKLLQATQRQKMYADRHTRPSKGFEKGDRVY